MKVKKMISMKSAVKQWIKQSPIPQFEGSFYSLLVLLLVLLIWSLTMALIIALAKVGSSEVVEGLATKYPAIPLDMLWVNIAATTGFLVSRIIVSLFTVAIVAYYILGLLKRVITEGE